MAHDILSTDLATAIQGAEQILAANEDGTWLKGVRHGRGSRYIHELLMEGPLGKDEAVHRVRQIAFLHLVAKGISPEAKALRDAMTHLDLLGTDTRWAYRKERHVIDLRGLELLPCSHLTIQQCQRVLWPEGPMQNLRNLHVDAKEHSLPDAPHLTRLRINGAGPAVLDVGPFPKVTDLTLSCTGLKQVVGLKDLPLERFANTSSDAPDLEIGSQLTYLAYTFGGTLTLGRQEKLAEVHLNRVDSLDLLDDVHGIQTLKLNQGTLASLDGLKKDELTQVELSNLPDLQDISALAGAPKLHHLYLRSCGVVEFTALGAGLPSLTSAQFYRCDQLHTLKGLGAAPKLQRLNLDHCKKLAKATGLGNCKELTHITLRHCGKEVGLDLLGLEGATALKTLQLTGSRVGKTRIPESLWPVVSPPSMVKRSGKRRKSDKPKPKAATGAARGQAARLKKLIMSRDLDRIDQAAELVGILGEDVAGAITHGCTIKKGAPLRESLPKTARYTPTFWDEAWDKMVPNSLLDHSDIVMPYRGHAMRVLASCGGAPSLADIESVVMVGRTKRYSGRVAVRLDPIEALENLKRVAVYECSELQGAHALEGLQRFCGYALVGVEAVADVAGPTEIALDSRGFVKRLGTSDKLDRLESLELASYGFALSVDELLRLRRLKRLALRSINVEADVVEKLGRLPLESLEVESHNLDNLEVFTAVGDLQHIGVRVPYGLSDLSPLSNHDSVRMYRPGGGLDTLTGVRKLALNNSQRQLDLNKLGCKDTVEELELIDCSLTRTSVPGLVDWPKLKKVRLPRRAVTTGLRNSSIQVETF